MMSMLKQSDNTGKLLISAGTDPKLTEQIMALLYGVGTPGLPLPQGFSVQMQKTVYGCDCLHRVGFQL